MCLYIDPYDFDGEWFGDGHRTARKEHRCQDCGRTIEPGETYQWWTWKLDGTVTTDKQCRHCEAVVALGVSLTGCPPVWTAGLLYDLDPEVGFVGNIVFDEGHTLTEVERDAMLATVDAAKSGWRDPDGALMPLPAVPMAEVVS